MARIRTIKPEFWTSEQIVECSQSARLLFIGIWTFSDDFGNIPAKVTELRLKIFPGDKDTTDQHIREMIGELLRTKLLISYEAQELTYWHVSGWKHQKIDKPSQKYPKFDEVRAKVVEVRPKSPEVGQFIPADVSSLDVSSLEGKGCSNTSEGSVRETAAKKGNGAFETPQPITRDEMKRRLKEFEERRKMP